MADRLTIEEDFMRDSRTDEPVPDEGEQMRKAATVYIEEERKTRDPKLSRTDIETAIIDDTGISQRELDAALVKMYDDLAKLGMVTPRKIREVETDVRRSRI